VISISIESRRAAKPRLTSARARYPRPVDGSGYLARLSDGTTVRARAMLVASGVDWRRLEIPGLDDLLGSGVYYGAGPSEAVTCIGCRVAVIGGGNSAGQAVVRFSRYAAHVTLLVAAARSRHRCRST
jgi:thioredoxin reductase (NADPH)